MSRIISDDVVPAPRISTAARRHGIRSPRQPGLDSQSADDLVQIAAKITLALTLLRGDDGTVDLDCARVMRDLDELVHAIQLDALEGSDGLNDLQRQAAIVFGNVTACLAYLWFASTESTESITHSWHEHQICDAYRLARSAVLILREIGRQSRLDQPLPGTAALGGDV